MEFEMRFDKEKSDNVALDLLGMEFKMGARGENRQIDCYGVLVHYYSAFGIKLPDYAIEEEWDCKEELYLRDYATMMRKVPNGESLQIGDMLLFKNVVDAANHAGIYLGEGRFIHSYSKAGTRIDKMYNKIWKDKFYGAFRIKE